MKIPEIYIPCCDDSLPIVKINSYLFNKLWPSAKVNYLGFKKPEFNLYSENHKFHSIAEVQEGGASKWTRYIHNFLKDVESDTIIFSIDDYLLCTPPNLKMIEFATNFLRKNKKVGRFDLTFDSQIEGNILPIKNIKKYNIGVKHPKAPYRISTQPAIWDRNFLLGILDHDWSPWDFELRGTHQVSTSNKIEQTFCFYDNNLENYPIRTIAKGAVSRFNPDGFNVLGMPVELIKELVSQKFIDEDKLMWGQHSNNPPSFQSKEGYNFHPSFLEYHPTSKTAFEEYNCIYDDPDSPLLTVNLWDKNFVHTLNHPDFGYITSQGEKAPRGKKLRFVPFKKRFKDYSGITIFTDRYLNSESINSVDCPVKIGWIMEPPVVHPWAYEAVPKIIDDLDYLFSFSDELSEKYDKCHTFSWCYIRLNHTDWGIHKKNKMLSMIASKKNWAPGHILRHKIADKLSEKNNIDLWGHGFKPFPQHGKILALKDYMFSIVIQNCQLDTFFTDFVDPLVTGTIPIYWGTKKVSEKFDENGIIFFDSFEELEDILNNLTEEDYYSRMNAIKNNFEIAKTYWRSDDQLADFIRKTVKFED